MVETVLHYNSHNRTNTPSLSRINHNISKNKKDDQVISLRNNHNNVTTVYHNHTTSSTGLWMILDGIGLALIAACTILEGFDLWREYFNEYWDTNSSSLTFWLSGRTSQVIGLIFLLSHAASFQIFPEVERFGMLMLTIGPLLNLTACSLFDSGNDPLYLFNKQWLSSETLELVGISLLDVSLIDMEEAYVLFFEVIGFLILCCAAMLDFEYNNSYNNGYFPVIELRLDLVHTNECFGLIILTIVAVGQYRIKIYKHNNIHHTHESNNRYHNQIMV